MKGWLKNKHKEGKHNCNKTITSHLVQLLTCGNLPLTSQRAKSVLGFHSAIHSLCSCVKKTILTLHLWKTDTQYIIFI